MIEVFHIPYVSLSYGNFLYIKHAIAEPVYGTIYIEDMISMSYFHEYMALLA